MTKPKTKHGELFVFNPSKPEQVLALRLYQIIRETPYIKASLLQTALGCSGEELMVAFQWLIDTGKLTPARAPKIDPLSEDFSTS